MRRSNLPLLALALLFTGCVANTFTTVLNDTVAITLVNTEERAIRMGGEATLPAGDYLPDFVSDEGVFYLAPTSVTIRSLGVAFPARGGLFVPHASRPKMKQAAWIRLPLGRLIGGVLSSDTSGIESYPFDEPVKYTSKQSTE